MEIIKHNNDMIHIKRLNEMNKYQSAMVNMLNACDTLRIGSASYTFACAFGNGDWEDLPETHRRISGQLRSFVKGNGSVEIEWDLNLDTGTIAGWDSGLVEIYFKVADMGEYMLMKDGKPVCEVTGEYVPNFLQIEDKNTYGDYISIMIDENGHINGWNGNLKRQVFSFFRKYGRYVGTREVSESRDDGRYYYFSEKSITREVYVPETFDDEFKSQFDDMDNRQLYEAIKELYDLVAGDPMPNKYDRDELLSWIYEYAREMLENE